MSGDELDLAAQRLSPKEHRTIERIAQRSLGRGSMPLGGKDGLGESEPACFMALANPDPEKWVGWGSHGLAAGLGLAILGLLTAIPRPAIGLGLGVAGTVVLMSAMPWAFFVFLPVPLPHWLRFARSRPSHPVPASAVGG